ncbi:MAG: tetratricopeptide repeat protein [Thermoproteota archaeon]
MKRFEEALKIDREIGNRQGEASDLGNIGRVYLRKDELDEALKYLEEALDILNRFNLVYGRDIIEEAIREIKRRKGESQ